MEKVEEMNMVSVLYIVYQNRIMKPTEHVLGRGVGDKEE
jgi:hypothetical protein